MRCLASGANVFEEAHVALSVPESACVPVNLERADAAPWLVVMAADPPLAYQDPEVGLAADLDVARALLRGREAAIACVGWLLTAACSSWGA